MPLGPHLTWHQEETGYDTQLGGGGEAVSFEGFLSVLHSSADVVLRPPVPPHPPSCLWGRGCSDDGSLAPYLCTVPLTF